MPADPTNRPNEGGQPVQAVQAPILIGKVPVPPKIELSGNSPNKWQQWRQVWSAYELIAPLNEQTDQYLSHVLAQKRSLFIMAFHFKAKTRRRIQRKSSNYENPITSGKRILFMKDIASIIAIKTPANQSILTHHIRDLSLMRVTLERLKKKL